MLTLLDNGGTYELPTNWSEVSTKQFCDTDPLRTVEERASYFAGRPIQVNGLVADVLAWMLTPPPLGSSFDYPADLGQETYLQVETIRALLAAAPLHQCFAQVYGTYTARQHYYRDRSSYRQDIAGQVATNCLAWDIVNTYPAVAHCLTELQRLATKYAELAEPDPTEAAARARAAGADELLGIFGHYNVARALAQQMGITLDAAYQLPFESVCVHLLHERRSAILADTIQRNAARND